MFDYRKAKEIDLLEAPSRRVRKLSQSEQCSIFAFRRVATQDVLARAFGVTKVTVSSIANCANSSRKTWRYRAVAEEFQRLGEDEFDRRYYTDEIRTRIQRLKHDVAEATDDRTLKGPNPLADKYANKRFWIPDWQGKLVPFIVKWALHPDWPDEPIGWRFRNDEDNNPAPVWHGLESSTTAGAGPFRTSAEAYDGAWTMMDRPSDRPKAGRPKAGA